MLYSLFLDAFELAFVPLPIPAYDANFIIKQQPFSPHQCHHSVNKKQAI